VERAQEYAAMDESTVGEILESPENGSVRLYRWCAACRGASMGVGDVEEADDGEAFIV
jgi:hypothetical protein